MDSDCDGSDIACSLCGLCDKPREEKELLETSLDEEMREALELSTPAGPSPNPNPRCKIDPIDLYFMRLLLNNIGGFC